MFECNGEGGFLGVLCDARGVCVFFVHVGKEFCVSSAVRCWPPHGVALVGGRMCVKAHSPLLLVILGRRVLLVRWKRRVAVDDRLPIFWVFEMRIIKIIWKILIIRKETPTNVEKGSN